MNALPIFFLAIFTLLGVHSETFAEYPCDPLIPNKQRPEPSDCIAALSSYDKYGKGSIIHSNSHNQKTCYTCQIEVASYGKTIDVDYAKARIELDRFLQRCTYRTGSFDVRSYGKTPARFTIDYGTSGHAC
ncbi:hypothetical protein O181_001465 [Austropuccinia psidii MF-1]|uniref:Secreted protein n=1 Tax=Austropuccinia psidii MF-1 TaxID=1389203 RepID=A0A9Q3BAM5_9BASI|nr:hypothetical protein [Austropuccinia psidii MF-1]